MKQTLTITITLVVGFLAGWFWRGGNYDIPMCVISQTKEERARLEVERAVMKAYWNQPSAPWITPGMTREEMQKAFEQSFSDPPEVNGILWQVFSGDGYSIQVPTGYYEDTGENFYKGGKDPVDGRVFEDSYVRQWLYNGDSAYGGTISLFVTLDPIMGPKERAEENYILFGIEKSKFKEFTIGNRTVLLHIDEDGAEAWIKSDDHAWYEVTMGFESRDEYFEKELPVQQALLKYIVHSLTIY